MKLHGTDDTMVCSSHLHSFVTAEVEHAVALCGQFSYRPFRYIIVYRIIPVFLIGKDPVPELLQVVQRFRQVGTSICFLLGKFRIEIRSQPYHYLFRFQALPSFATLRRTYTLLVIPILQLVEETQVIMERKGRLVTARIRRLGKFRHRMSHANLVFGILELGGFEFITYNPALNSVTPLLVPEEQLTKCAGYSQSLQSISYIVSPAVAALLYSVWDLNAIIAIDVLGAVIASITVAIVRIPKLGDRVQSLEPNFIREMKEGMAVLRQNKGLFALLLVGTLYMFVYMPINALYPLITMECFNGTPMHISITEIAYASGMLIGGLLLGLFGNYQKRILLITASIFMMGISLTISGLLPQSGFFIFVVCCAIMGLSVPFYSGVQTALFQEKIKPEYLGRVFSLTGSIMSLAMPIGLILSGFFADRIGVNHWFLLSGVLIIGIAIACPMITEVRKLDLKQNS